MAAIRRVRTPGVKFDEMLVLEGKQGTNKSSGIRALVGEASWFLDDLTLSADGRTMIERLSGIWIAEFAELKGMKKSEVESVKALLSRQSDTARMAYARMPVTVLRQCVFIGTTNSSRYLKDSTGNRRFWPVKVQTLDVNAITRDRDQLWAEAAVLEASVPELRLDPELWKAAAAEQQAREVEDPYIYRIEEILGDAVGKVRCSDAIKMISKAVGYQTTDDNSRIGDAMRVLDWERLKVRFGGSKTEWAYCRGTAEERLRIIDIDELMRPDGDVEEDFGRGRSDFC